jgi:hypothetical protein
MTGASCTAARHGTRSAAHEYGCTCADAVAKARRYNKFVRAGVARLARDVDHRVDRVGTVRRVQSLYAIGKREADLAPRLGYTSGRLHFMHEPDRDHVFASTAAKVRALYEMVRNSPGPSERNRRRARPNGYFTPDQWDLVDIDNPAHRPDDPAARHATWKARYATNPVGELCRTHPDPQLWFSTRPVDSQRAVSVCTLCPLVRDCLAGALIGDERHGVWGGLAEDELRQVRKPLVAALDGRPIEGSPELETVLERFTGGEARCA